MTQTAGVAPRDIEEFERLERQATQGPSTTLSTEQKIVELKRRGIVEGALVVDPEKRLGRVIEIGEGIKVHSTAPDKRSAFYVTLRRVSTGKGGRVRTRDSKISFDGALSLKVAAP